MAVAKTLRSVLNLYACDMWGDGSEISDPDDKFEMPEPCNFKEF